MEKPSTLTRPAGVTPSSGTRAAADGSEMENMLEFQNQLKTLMQDLKEGMRELKTELKNRSGSPSQRIVGLVTQLDKTNSRFFEAATRAQTAPQISLYDGSTRTAIIRASAESNRDAAAAGGYGERGVVISRAVSAGKDATLLNDTMATTKSSGTAVIQVIAEAPSEEEQEEAVPDDGFPTQSKVIFKMNRGELPKKHVKGQALPIAPHLNALYQSGTARPKGKGGAQGGVHGGNSAGASGQNQNQESVAMFPEVVKSGKTQAPTKLGSGVDRAVVTTGKVVADDDDARCANKMDPSMRVLLKRTENMVEEARKATRKTKSKKKGKTPIVIQNDNVEGVQETVNTGYGPIDTIHEAEEEEHDYDITDEWEQSAAGGGSSSTTSRAATARTTTRPSSRQLHSSSSTRGAKSPSGRSNSPHSRAPSAQGRDRPHSRAASTGSPKRPPSRSTVTELFAMSPEDVVQQQKLLTDMGWTQQRVHEGEKEVARGASRSKAKRKDEEEGGEEAEAEGAVGAHTTLEWQNELARHILSMYATTTAAQHMPESRAILEFVDTKRSGSVNITSHELFPGGGGAGEVSFESLVQEEIVATKLARASSKARLLGLKPKDSTIPVESRATTVDTSAVVATTDSENFSKLETLQPHKHSKAPKFPTKGGEGVHPKAIQSSGANRVPLPGDVTMLRGHDGEPVPARPMGPPKCFPVWFVGTGDVYSDWSALSVSKVIDGVKLQAQLQVMSENREFWKYLGVVEAIINRYYKVVLERETQLVEERKLLASVEAQAAFAQSMESRSPSPQRGRSSSRSPSRSPRRSPSRSPSRSPVRTATEDRPTTTTSSQSPSHSRSQSRSQSQSQSQSQSRAQSVMGHSRSASPDWAPLPSSKMLSRKSFAEINTEDWGAGTGSEFFSADQPLSQEATGILGADAPSVVTVDPNPTLKDRVNIGVFWLQLVSTGVAMVTLSVEDKKYDLAMNMLQRLERWSTREDLLTHKQRLIARACTLDAFAYYFFRRRKLFASLRHTKLAAALHEKLRNNDGIAAGLLQVAVVECFQAKFKECHKTIYQFLAMIEDGRLAFQTATPRQLCLVAVGYHNLAVVQLKMQHSDLAAKSSQNARKIARLCLSTSTRFLATFQMTHDAASKDMGFHIKHRPGAAGYGGELENAGDSTLGVLNRMTEDFFKTVPDMDGESWQEINGTPSTGPDKNAKGNNKLPKLKGAGTTTRAGR